MDGILNACRPLADVLWEREWTSGDWSTPERRAQLQRQISALTAKHRRPECEGPL